MQGVLWGDSKRNLIWAIGDTYYVYDNGRKVWGTIVDILQEGCVVEWDDGSRTMEGTPEPASDWLREHPGENGNNKS